MTSTSDPPAADAAAPDAGPGPRGPRLGYLPALDGLRGLAAAGVVLFHAQVGWMPGGFLAVTTFFALSGFLLTSLLMAEHRQHGTVDARAFWGRRFRRLLPAALLTLGTVAVLAPWLATAEQLATLRGDVVAALVYLANWRFIAEGRAYQDLFADPSPVQHFWTLSIEEQVFLVLPLLAVAAAAVAGRWLPTGDRTRAAERTAALRRVLLPALGVLTLASVVTLWVTYDPADDGLVAYYSTFSRASEFLIGALAAVALGRPRAVGGRRGATMAAVAGPLALGALLGLWVTTTDGSAWLYHGGFPLVAALSTVVLLACLHPGPLATALGTAPLRELGRRSYGVYLFHWPVLLWLTADRVGLDGNALLALQLAVVGGLAWASFRFVEQPVRLRRVLPGRRALVAAGVGMAAVVGAVGLATLDPPAPELVFERQADPTATVAAGAGGPPTVLVVGDSLAANLAAGLARRDATELALYDRTTPGCGLAESERRVEAGDWKAPDPDCAPGWEARWSTAVGDIDPDVVVLQVGTQEVWDRRVDGTEVPFDDPRGAALRRGEVDRALDVLTSGGARVVLVTLPASRWATWGLRLADEDRSVNNPAWVSDWNATLRQAAAGRDDVTVVELGEVLTPNGSYQPELDGVTVRAGDGLHLTDAGQDVAASAVVPAIEVGAAG